MGGAMKQAARSIGPEPKAPTRAPLRRPLVGLILVPPLALCLLFVAVGRSAAQTTITTTYRYNADGALTAVTKQVGTQALTTTFSPGTTSFPPPLP